MENIRKNFENIRNRNSYRSGANAVSGRICQQTVRCTPQPWPWLVSTRFLPSHREAAEQLIQATTPARLAATRLVRAGDPTAGDWLLRAARQAAPHFPDMGVESYDQALWWAGPSGRLRSLVEVERAEALLRAGRLDDAIAPAGPCPRIQVSDLPDPVTPPDCCSA